MDVRWGITFLLADLQLTPAQRFYVAGMATHMYYSDQKKCELEFDGLEGVLTTDGDYQTIGSFGGQRFDAEVDTAHGKGKLRFLVSEQTGAWYFSADDTPQ